MQTPPQQTIPFREYLERVIEEKDKQYDMRFHAAEIALAAALEAQQKALYAALQAQKEAVNKSDIATETRFQSVNEFRSALSDLQSTLMPRAESMALLDAVNARSTVAQQNHDSRLESQRASFEKSVEALAKDITALREYRSSQSGKSTGANALWGYFVAGMGVLFGLGGLILAIVFHFAK